jgi:hypothetical protein
MSQSRTHTFATAVADLSEAELRALTTAANDVSYFAPVFLGWLEDLGEWELDRREGSGRARPEPPLAVSRDEDQLSVTAAMLLRQRFKHALPRVASLLSGVVGVLASNVTLH